MNLNNNAAKGKYVLGLTGGIGTGKSTAAEYLVSKGFEHVDADQISRDITRKGSPMLDVLEKNFGKGSDISASESSCEHQSILFDDGSLDRKKLASIVFSDPEKKNELDRIMFREIERIINKRIKDATGPVLLDAPLIFESGIDRLCDSVILLICDLETRIHRVTERDGATRDEVISRIKSQMTDDEKAKMADHVIDNSGSVEELHRQLDRIVIDKQVY